MTTVTRFAPSPTGFLHIGGARTALFNWLYAKHKGGMFYLRIEDTDRIRSITAAVDAICSGLHWLGILWDGEVIFQSTRIARHVAVAQELLKCGIAYRCYYTPGELATIREAARRTNQSTGYNNRWRNLDASEIPPGVPPTIRLRTSRVGETTLKDLVQGCITVANEQLDDMILLRADGTPTYMLSVVVDDHDMGITHVIRGDDHLTNTFRQIQIYQAMGWDVPQFAHIPLIHGHDSTKLSKRHGALGTEAYRDMGFLPEAVCNYLTRLGWGHNNAEVFTTEQAITWFDIKDVGRSAARFDIAKLTALNAHYLRECDNIRLVKLIVPYLEVALGMLVSDTGRNRLQTAMPSLKIRARTVQELAKTALFYVQPRPLQLDDSARQQLDASGKTILVLMIKYLATENRVWEAKALEEWSRYIAAEQGLALVKLTQPLRAALTGSTVSPPIFEIMQVLGREETLARLNDVF